jgi:hypothetical protein
VAVPTSGFWQLLFQKGSGQWTLATPPGVADNGGLVLSRAGSAGIEVGIRPSHLLEFTPLALMSRPGGHWAPSVLDAPLADEPDALVANPTRSGVVITGGRRPQLLEAGGTTPSQLSSLALLKRRLPSCSPAALTAAAEDAGTPVLGLDCRRPRTVGIVTAPWSSPRYAAPRLLGAAGDDVTVLRLSVSGTRWSALLAARPVTGTGGVSLFGASSSDAGAAWRVSPGLALGPLDGQLVTDPYGPAGWAVWQGGAGHVIHLISAGRSWTASAAPPQNTVAVAVSPGGRLTAFATRTKSLRLTVYGLTTGTAGTGGRWTRQEEIFVPIEFGSSS